MEFKNKEPYYCSVCNKILKPLTDIENIDSGTVTQVWAGFGSKHDGDVFQVCFCDECIDYLKQKRKIKILGNYLGFPFEEMK